MPKFRKKPIVIEAVQFTGKLPYPDGVVFRCYPDEGPSYLSDGPIFGRHKAVIKTLEGEMEVSDGDWVITGVNGEKYPCKPDIFEKTYEPA